MFVLFCFLSFVLCWLMNALCHLYDTLSCVFLLLWLLVFCPPTFVSFWCRLSCASSRLALDNAIRHKQLNISSRFSPRVAGENDFLQTVINKVIAAKEVNHKGQGRYYDSFTLLVWQANIAASNVSNNISVALDTCIVFSVTVFSFRTLPFLLWIVS